MGYGDALIASGQARQYRQRTARKIHIADKNRRAYWNELWAYSPSILRPVRHRYSHMPPSYIINGPGARPYIDYVRSTPDRWVWKEWECPAGELVGLPQDSRAAGMILIEPHIKARASPNKQWPHWQALVGARPDLPWGQMCPPGQPALRGVKRIETASFIQACSVLAGAVAAVLPDGGLHHAAAALDIPAVVIQGGFIGPKQTGYAQHRNIHDGVACGWRVPCEHCRKAMAAITPDQVLHELEQVLEHASQQPTMKCIGGVWLPAHETHLVEWMKKKNQVVDGKLTYQLDKQSAALGLCRQFRTAIDIGAHCGLWSMNLAKRFKHVHAFEPVALHRDCFVRNVTTSNVTLYAMALGEKDGSVSMVTAPSSSGDTTVGGEGDIPLRRLDDVLADVQDVDLIKADTEGMELPILRGAEQLLLRCKPTICVEQKPGKAQKFGFAETDAISYLHSLGYRTEKVISGDYFMVPK